MLSLSQDFFISDLELKKTLIFRYSNYSTLDGDYCPFADGSEEYLFNVSSVWTNNQDIFDGYAVASFRYKRFTITINPKIFSKYVLSGSQTKTYEGKQFDSFTIDINWSKYGYIVNSDPVVNMNVYIPKNLINLIEV